MIKGKTTTLFAEIIVFINIFLLEILFSKVAVICNYLQSDVFRKNLI